MIIARQKEIAALRKALTSERSEFIAVYGRRRIGKTFLIQETFGYSFAFQFTGIANSPKKDQLTGFRGALKEYGMAVTDTPETWLDAFELLKDLIRKNPQKRKVIFLDELAWMDTANSGFIPALESFWNGWASSRRDVVLIVCASATSWILNKVVHAKGGLYNRLTYRLNLKPLCLGECREFAKVMNLPFSDDQIIEAYMVLGGIPYYWTLLKSDMSLAQNVDFLCFSEDAPLKNELSYILSSIFKSPKIYEDIIRILGDRKVGKDYSEIQSELDTTQGGNLTRALEDLENCGFIRHYKPFGRKKKGSLYQLMDNFTLFYLRFMDGTTNDRQYWSHKYNDPAVNNWRGLAFERVCLWHSEQIKDALRISGINTEVCSWHCKEDKEKGIKSAQIDLVIDRADKQVNLCEIKYSQGVYTLTASDERGIRDKISSFLATTSTNKGIQVTMITTHGVTLNSHRGVAQTFVEGEDLFAIPK